MIDFSIAIQHTPDQNDRRQWVRKMTEQIHRESPHIALSVIEDIHRVGCWPTHRRALTAGGDASHHLVLQDDMALCKDFVASVTKAIQARPEDLISLYSSSPKVLTARERGDSWLKGIRCGPAVVWPSGLIGPFLDWEAKHMDQRFQWDDLRISIWLFKTAQKCFATVPSLVQHLGWDSSVLGLDSPTKIATWFIGLNQSAGHMDWQQGLHSTMEDPYRIPEKWLRYYRE